MKISESQYKANRKYRENNTYQRTVAFNIKDFPIEMYNECIEKIKDQNLSFNKFVMQKLKEELKKNGVNE